MRASAYDVSSSTVCDVYGDIEQIVACQQLEADLRAQNNLVDATRLAIWVSILALIGLGATVHYARQAWIAARDTANATHHLGEAQLRAYVCVENICVHRIPGPGGEFQLHFSVTLKNCGQTPAFDMAVSTKCIWGDKKALNARDLQIPASKEMIGPQMTREISRMFRKNYTAINIASYAMNESTIWIKGRARYKDINSKRWELNFAAHLRDPLRLQEGDLTMERTFGMTAADEGNTLTEI